MTDKKSRLLAQLEEKIFYNTTQISALKFRLEQSHSRPNELADYNFFIKPNQNVFNITFPSCFEIGSSIVTDQDGDEIESK
jgi:hypothetical protein